MAGDLRRDLLLWTEKLLAIEHLAGLSDDDLLVRLLRQSQERQPEEPAPQRIELSEPSDLSALFVPAFQSENTAGSQATTVESAQERPEPEPDRSDAPPNAMVPPPAAATSEVLTTDQSSGEESDIELVAREQVRLYLRRAGALWRHGDREGAVAACSRAIELRAQWAGGYLTRGQMYRLRGKPTLAVADFTEAIRLHPDNAEAWLHRGTIYKEAGVWEKAGHDFSAALEANPRLTVAYMNRALVRARQNAWADAVKDASAAIRLDPDCRGALFIRGSALLRLGKHGQALADLSMLLQHEPENFLAFNERGLVYAGQGDFRLALRDYQQALRLKPRFVRAHINRAVALSLSGDVDSALAYLNRLIAAEPGQPVLYCHRGRVRLARQEAEAARADFERALAMQPNFAEAAQGLADAQLLLDPEQAAAAELSAEEDPTELAADNPASDPATTNVPETIESNASETTGGAKKAPAEAHDKSKNVVITLTCLNCQAESTIGIDKLGKRFKCPKCRHVYRVDAGGQLKRITPTRSRRDGFKAWIAQYGLRVLTAAVLVLALGSGIGLAWQRYGRSASLPPLPDGLEARAEQMAKAWYTGDTELVRRFTHGPQGRRLKFWMNDNQPPTGAKNLSLAEKQQTQVQVHIRDEKRDAVRLELKVTHPMLPTVFIDLHWVRGEDSWYFQPFPEKVLGGTALPMRATKAMNVIGGEGK